MAYPAFLTLMSQLTEGRKARAQMGEETFFLEQLEQKNRWLFSMPLLKAEGELLSCFSSTGIFYLENRGISLRLDLLTQLVYAEKKVEMPGKQYVVFRDCLALFLKQAREYHKLLHSSV